MNLYSGFPRPIIQGDFVIIVASYSIVLTISRTTDSAALSPKEPCPSHIPNKLTFSRSNRFLTQIILS